MRHTVFHCPHCKETIDIYGNQAIEDTTARENSIQLRVRIETRIPLIELTPELMVQGIGFDQQEVDDIVERNLLDHGQNVRVDYVCPHCGKEISDNQGLVTQILSRESEEAERLNTEAAQS